MTSQQVGTKARLPPAGPRSPPAAKRFRFRTGATTISVVGERRRALALTVLVAVATGACATLAAPAPGPALAQARAADRPRPVAVGTPPEVAEPPEHAPPADPVRPRRSVSIVMGGDLLWHNSVWQSAAEDAAGTGKAYDFAPMFRAVRPVVAGADIAICQEEVPFAAPGQPPQNYPLFAAPHQVAAWIADAGFDACVTASNHAVDQQYDGLARTADLLEASGVAHVGTFRSRAERRRPVVLTTDQGVKVGIVAGTYSLNGLPMPPGRPWAVSLWDPRNLLAQARRARRAGADVVVVNLHGGDEYSPVPNADQRALVRRLTASPYVDLVLGEHAHVVQPITRVNGTWVVYGMGNMIAQQDPALRRTYEGILVRFDFREGAHGRFRVVDAAYVPTYWTQYSPGRPIRVRRVVTALAAGRGDTARLLEARAATRAAVTALGRPRGLSER